MADYNIGNKLGDSFSVGNGLKKMIYNHNPSKSSIKSNAFAKSMMNLRLDISSE